MPQLETSKSQLASELDRASKSRRFVAVSPTANMTALNDDWDALLELLRKCQQLLDALDEFERLRALHNEDVVALNSMHDSLSTVLQDANATAGSLQSSLDRHNVASGEIESRISDRIRKCKSLLDENRLPADMGVANQIQDMEKTADSSLNRDRQLRDNINGRIEQIKVFEDAKHQMVNKLADVEANIGTQITTGDDDSAKKQQQQKKKKGKKQEPISAESAFAGAGVEDEETLKRKIAAQMVCFN